MTNQTNTIAYDGLTGAKPASKFLGIGVSSWWLYVKQGRIKKPLKLSTRTSRWECPYVRKLGKEGLPPVGTEHPDETKKAGEVA
ncbi:helix-turn-helix transcriptional regulator [Leucothrix pacifica]|uniref:helix-turn-helix transcriptional regulator n=1 Tax=Leucothrix pacifica TaxID=1247513 RepID=UPI0015E84CE7|nr:hypothetical protein [Leucothrix pacifica]